MAANCPYSTLGVGPEAGAEEIRRAYRACCLRLHPDKSGTVDSAEFQAVQDAWSLLGDKAARQRHDDERRRAAAHLEAEYTMAEEVFFDEMRPAARAGWRSRACRCGAVLEVAQHELEGGSIVVPCDGCSLSIRVASR